MGYAEGLGWGGSWRGRVGHVGVGWGGSCRLLSSDKLLSTAFWIMWEKACFCCFVFFASCFGRKHFSSIENTGNLYAFIC